GLVHQMMSVAASSIETRAHSRMKRCPPGVGDQCRASFENVDELVLLLMRMAQRRHPAGRNPAEVDTEVLEPEQVAEGALDPARAAPEERLGIVRGARWRVRGDDGYRAVRFGVGHGAPPECCGL